jgi:hypothetical protein
MLDTLKLKYLCEYRDVLMRIKNEGLEDRFVMTNAATVGTFCETAYCVGGWYSHFNFNWRPGDTTYYFNGHTSNWVDCVSESASRTCAWGTTDMLFGDGQESGPEGLEILIKRANWFIDRERKWQAFEFGWSA